MSFGTCNEQPLNVADGAFFCGVRQSDGHGLIDHMAIVDIVWQILLEVVAGIIL